MEMKISELPQHIIMPREAGLMAPATITMYKFVIQQLTGYFGADKDLETMTLEEIKNYLLSKKTWKRTSVLRHVVYIQTIFSDLEKQKLLSNNVMRKIKVPKQEETPIELMSAEELEALDTASMSPVIDERTRVLYWIIRETGLRSTEVATILLADVDMKERFIYIRRSKNKITKTVPITESTCKLIQRYLASQRQTSLYLFPNRLSRVWSKPVGRGAVYTALKDIYDKAFNVRNWKHRKGPHLLRHHCATEWVEMEGSLIGLQYLMGWKSLKMCERYVHANKNLMRKHFDLVQLRKKEARNEKK